MAGSEDVLGEFLNAGKPGSSLDLWLAYDQKHALVWITLCSLRK